MPLDMGAYFPGSPGYRCALIPAMPAALKSVPPPEAISIIVVFLLSMRIMSEVIIPDGTVLKIKSYTAAF